MALKIDATLHRKLTCTFKNDMSKICISLKLTGEFCVIPMKNEAKFEEELSCQFKIDVRNLTNFDGLILNKVYNV